MITFGDKILETTLKAGIYPGRIIGFEEGEDVKFRGNIRKKAADFSIEMYINKRVIEKTKTYIISDMKSSELMQMVNSLLPEVDIEKDGVDLQELIGMECDVEIRIDYSKRGNRFENIGLVTLRDDESVSTDKEARA